MINDSAVDGTPISELKFNSRKKIVRTCDLCKQKSETVWNNIVRCRKKHNIIKDYCFKCSMIIYNKGDGNSSKRPDVRKKISQATKGKSKSFKDGKNLRILDKKITVNGYVLKWSDKYNTHIHEHRLLLAEKLNIDPDQLKSVHHINGDKIDNAIDNLIELDKNEHASLHHQIENIAFDLFKKGFIFFDKLNKRYYISPLIENAAIEKSFGFDNIAIKQKKNICNSRLDVNIKSEVIRGITLEIPLIAANMSTVINENFYLELRKYGALGIIHRAMNENELITISKNLSKKTDIVAMSIGVGESQYDLAKKLIYNGTNVICIDIAHGFSDSTISLAKKIKKFNSYIKIIIGNTTNTDMIQEVYEFIDAIKIGIAQGFACETKNTAGCTEKQFSAILKFKHLCKSLNIPIISDGGIREPADFVKSIAAGANSIMAGKIFAACPESAAEIVHVNNESKKVYAGMASRYVQEKWRGGLKDGTCPEGGVKLLDIGESLPKLLERYSGALKSGITYGGGNDINSFQNNVEFVQLV